MDFNDLEDYDDEGPLGIDGDEPIPEVIAAAEALLEHAKSGSVRGFTASATIAHNGSSMYSAGFMNLSSLGVLTMLQTRTSKTLNNYADKAHEMMEMSENNPLN